MSTTTARTKRDSRSSSAGGPISAAVESLRARASQAPKAAALLGTNRAQISYGELFAQIERVVATLNRLGLGRADRVAIILPNGPEMAAAFVAVSAATVCAPLNPTYREGEFDFYLSDLGARAVIVPPGDSAARTAARNRGIAVLELTSRPETAGLFDLVGTTTFPPVNDGFATADDTALVLHTSGTTSRPKLVPLTHANIWASVCNVQQALRLTPEDRCLNVMPLFHIHGLIAALLSTLSAGGSVVCTPGLDAAKFFGLLRDYRPTWFTAVPTMHQSILAEADKKPEALADHALRLIRSSSSALPPQVMRELERCFQVPVVEALGMTEAAYQVACNPLPPGQRKAGSVGLPAGPEVEIMDAAGNILGRVQTGEIVLRGKNITPGYENNPAANKAAFTRGWFRTGDQGYLDNDGYIYLTGRLKEIINRGGEKVSPREVDEVLLDHPAVAQAIAFAVPHPRLGEDIAAAVVLRDCATERELRDFAFARLAAFKVPSQIIVVKEIPKGSTGKLQRIGLASKLSHLLKTEHSDPTSRIEETLVRLWKKVLNLQTVGCNDNYFGLGGDSLLAAQLFLEIEQATGRKLPLATLFRAPTIRQLAEFLVFEEASWSPLVTIQEGSRPPLFCVHALLGNVLMFRLLAKHMGADQPIHALQAIGLDGKQTPQTRVEDMARLYVQEVRKLQPTGPYHFAGYSFGGLVAYEMAQQMLKSGEKIAFVGLIDTHWLGNDAESLPRWPRLRYRAWNRLFRVHRLVVSPVRRLTTILRRAKQKWEQMAGMRLREKASQAWGIIARQFRRNEPNSKSPKTEGVQNPTVQVVASALHVAGKQYVPQPYLGKATYFQSDELSRVVRFGPRLLWTSLTRGNTEIVRIPGDHCSIFEEPLVQTLAERLRGCIDQASPKSS